MGLLTWIKGVIDRMFTTEAEKAFGVDIATDTMMDIKIAEWFDTYQGHPRWLSGEDRIRTINMANTICEETARLTNLALEINIDGGARAEWLKKMVDAAIMPRLRNWIEYACATGTVIFKPNATGVDLVLPGSFRIVGTENGVTNDIIFQEQYTEGKDNNKTYYTKLERHSYMRATVALHEGEEAKEVIYYHVENKAFMSHSEKNIGKEVSLMDTKWRQLQPEVYITKANNERINTMLFGVFKMPSANDIDIDSPLGTAIFSGAMEELKDLDIAYSRNAGEIADSESICLVDDRLLNTAGNKIGMKPQVKLPHYVHNVFGGDTKEFYQEIDRQLKTEQRIKGINNQLSFIGYKCGYSNGYFVFDQKTGMVTATQVESDDRRTLQTIKDIRDSLKVALEDTIYALSVFADLYSLAPVGEYETSYSFGDIVYSFEADKEKWYQYASKGQVPFWLYLVKFEGMSEEEAKQICEEAKKENQKTELFGEE